MRLLLLADRLIDGTGSAPIHNGAVLIADGRIEAVASRESLGASPGDGAEVVEVKGGSIMPGFIEAHSHIHCSSEEDAYNQLMTEGDDVLLMRGVQAVRAALNSGVTTMRDLGSRNQVVFPLRQAIEDGIIPGPRLMPAGTPITTTGGHCNMFGTEADTVEEVVTAVRNQVKLGADFIKLMTTGGNFTPRTNVRAAQFPAQTLRAAVVDAERLGVRVAGHCHGSVGVRNATEAGIHTLVHSTWLSPDPSKAFDYDPKVADTIAEKGLYVDPTIAINHIRLARGAEPIAYSDDGDPKAEHQERSEILRDMWDRGIKFVSGLDTGMVHVRFGDFAYTPESMVVDMGIKPMEAIVTCTRTTAECLGILDETGTLEAGKLADVVIVNCDPSADIRAMHDVNTVVKAGSLVKRDGVSLV